MRRKWASVVWRGPIIEVMSSTMAPPVSPEVLAKYEPVIGLEVHVQLATRTKIFCSVSDELRSASKPERLPRLSGSARRLAGAEQAGCGHGDQSRIGAELQGQPLLTVRAKKLLLSRIFPKGYQISQYDQPFAEHGWVDVEAAA